MRSVQRLFGEAKGKMNGYVALLTFRYSNLCVKADAISLLPVNVTIDGEDTNIENVADVAIPKNTVLAVIPKDTAHLNAIGNGILNAHPEFVMEVVQNKKSNDEEDKYLTFTMPEVDETRHSELSDGVDSLYKQCKTKLDHVFHQYGDLINGKMQENSAKEKEEVSNQLKELFDYYDQLCEQMTETKKKEIESAWQEYQKEHKNKSKSHQSENAAHNTQAGLRMTMA